MAHAILVSIEQTVIGCAAIDLYEEREREINVLLCLSCIILCARVMKTRLSSDILRSGNFNVAPSAQL